MNNNIYKRFDTEAKKSRWVKAANHASMRVDREMRRFALSYDSRMVEKLFQDNAFIKRSPQM